jgi:hypothetical protein
LTFLLLAWLQFFACKFLHFAIAMDNSAPCIDAIFANILDAERSLNLEEIRARSCLCVSSLLQ